MELIIKSPTSSQKINIKWLEAETTYGNLTILQGHAPLITILAPNKELTLKLEDDSTTVMTISGGILEVLRKKIILLITQD